MHNVTTVMLYFCILYLTLMGYAGAERFQYISTEHPKVLYMNPKYLNYANLTSRRYGRHDPFYYVEIHADALHAFSNNVTVDIYIYEWLTNVYKRSFVEMHFKFCDLIHKDKFFGSALKQGKLLQPCPYPPGEYHLYNMTVPVKEIPAHFPFTKGRIFGNITATDANEQIARGYIDMEIKTFNTDRKKVLKSRT